MEITFELETPHKCLPIICEVKIDGFYNNSDCGGLSRDYDICEVYYKYQNGRYIEGGKRKYLDERLLDIVERKIRNELN